MRLDIFSQIEKAIVFEVNKIIYENKKVLPNNAPITVDRGTDKSSDLPSVNIAITSGEISPISMGSNKMTINIEVVVVSTNPRTEADRRDDLYPILFAVIRLLAGRALKDEKGKELPINNIYPTGKFGQVSQTGEQLAYTANFETSLTFANFQEEDTEEIRGFLLNYYAHPKDVHCASDKIELNEKEEESIIKGVKHGK